ncbi:SDR family NAD(P)-dependent oxidoreductase [Niveibacterium sp. 24ML]|uniref:SDR family NAD(P)-dependent oxidoreductase n=1 Tax=Niveibacterium sp. 24ML TaxID=2985512 RepID=UPI002270669A|nr:SDR family NAD(P)-dependent oxidoreductase [Niveibacterium sp. 24ML]MCX9154911.1 SDR family NAD(P)-dependent oxidoreductase [Niveibacterium sp. 24ML]
MNEPIRDWRGKRVWIVGASTGIGAALAEDLAARGAHLALSARRVERLQAFVDRLPGSVAIPLDVAEHQTLMPALLQLLDLWGGIDVVIFNAGTYAPMRAWDLTVEGARTTFEINLMGVINGVAAVLPQFLQQGEGAIVIVGSVAGYRGLPKALAYGASKAAVINFAESLYMDLAPRGVSVFLVNPGFVETPLTAKNKFRMPALISAAEASRQILQGMARGRFEIHFPRRFTLMLKAMRFLPEWIYLRAVRRATGT